MPVETAPNRADWASIARPRITFFFNAALTRNPLHHADLDHQLDDEIAAVQGIVADLRRFKNARRPVAHNVSNRGISDLGRSAFSSSNHKKVPVKRSPGRTVWDSIAAPRVAAFNSALTSNPPHHGDLDRQLDDEISALRSVVARFCECKNTLRPVARLPTEILIHIFSLCIDGPTSSPSRRPHADLIPLTRVCGRWRDVALNTSALWRNINLEWGETWMAETLARAHLAPIDVVVHYRASALQRALVLQHLAHTRTLVLRDGKSAIEHDEDVRAFYQGLVAPAPLLEVLDIWYPLLSPATRDALPNGLFAGHAENLRRVKLSNIVGFPRAFPALGALVKLEVVLQTAYLLSDMVTPPPLGAVRDALSQMPHLEDLCFEHEAVPIADAGDPLPPPLALPLLKRLRLVGDVSCCAAFTECLQLPPLVKLDLDLICPAVADANIFFPVLAAHFGADNSAFQEVDLDSPRRAVAARLIRAWRGSAGRLGGAADVALQFTTLDALASTTDDDFSLTAVYGTFLRALFQAMPTLTAAEALHIGETDWTPEEWLDVLGTSSPVRSLDADGAVQRLCEALARSVAAEGDTDWRVHRTPPGARVFCCPRLETLRLAGCTLVGTRDRADYSPGVKPVALAACLRAREAGGRKVQNVALATCRMTPAVKSELEALLPSIVFAVR